MEPRDLIKGLVFAMKHKLAKREIEIICFLLIGVNDTDNLAKAMKCTHMAVHQTMIKLKDKGLVSLVGTCFQGRNVYKLNVID
ncbi:MAG: hypothetical protein ACTSU7_00345 [Candidatus Heimdallarchaeaceae archaeon]